MMKKRKMTTKRLILLTAFIGIIMMTVGCGKGDKGDSEKSLKIGKDFLEIMFTTDYEGRYTAFAEDEDTEKYYATFSGCASQECIDQLEQNRMPVKYESVDIEEGVSYVVSDVKLTFAEDGTGTYEVLLTEKAKKDEVVKKASGQLTVKGDKVDTFFLSNIAAYEQ